MAESTVKYPYAIDEKDRLVFINDVVRETRSEHQFRCPHCGEKMTPRQGNHNEWHFAHGENHKCGIESYIHKTAKHIIAERFNNHQCPFIIGLYLKRRCVYFDECNENKVPLCDDWRYYKQFDLTIYYDAIAEEEVDICEPDGITHFRPDVLLKSKNKKRQDIFIEVYYKSKAKEKKVCSGHRIIEIRIRDIEALKSLRKRELFEESDDVSFYNFDAPLATPDQIEKGLKESWGRWICNRDLPSCKQSISYKRKHSHLMRYVLMSDGREFVNGVFENELNSHYPTALIDITYDEDKLKGIPPFEYIIAMRIQSKRTCYMCEYCCATEYVTWCKALKNGSTRKSGFNPKKGITCDCFEWKSWAVFSVKEFENKNKEGVVFSVWTNPEQ